MTSAAAREAERHLERQEGDFARRGPDDKSAGSVTKRECAAFLAVSEDH